MNFEVVLQDACAKGLITIYKAVRLEGSFAEVLRQLDKLSELS